MSDVVFVRDGGPAPAEPPKQPRRRKPWWEVMDPGERASWRDLPRLLTDSLHLVWSAGRREFLITTTLQVITGLGIALQLFIARALFEAVLAAGGTRDLAGVAPELAALLAITVALDFARAVQTEQTRVLSRARRAPRTRPRARRLDAYRPARVRVARLLRPAHSARVRRASSARSRS